MGILLKDLIEGIGYATIDVTIETPVLRGNLAMEVDHITESEYGAYIEGADGNSLEISSEASIKREDDVFHVEMDDCYICIKLYP